MITRLSRQYVTMSGMVPGSFVWWCLMSNVTACCYRSTDTEGLPHMTQQIPVKGSGRVPEGYRAGRSGRRLQVIVLVILLLGLIVSEYLLIVNDVAVTTLSTSLATVLLTMDIADRLSVLLVQRRS